MRKIVSILFVSCLLFCVGSKSLALASDNFGELDLNWNVRGSLLKRHPRQTTLPFKPKQKTSDILAALSFSLEYLIPCEHFFTWADPFKVGLGASYAIAMSLMGTHTPGIGEEFFSAGFYLLPGLSHHSGKSL